ncbi:hypothetical protein ISS30_04255 [bacterium]|nr:hypothetical protein [FCB group bacterium]MBL7190886.1 hypothetical protein [bacterium]
MKFDSEKLWLYTALTFSLAFIIYRLAYLSLQPVPYAIGDFKDDAYYYFKIAQNIVESGISTFDGINVTNGYHPLWMLMILPIFVIFKSDLFTPLYVISILQILLFVGFLYFNLKTVYKIGNSRAVLICTLILFLLRFHVIYFSGMETMLNLFIIALIFQELLFRKNWQGYLHSPGKIFATGVLTALMILSRLDTIFFAFAIAGIILMNQIKLKGVYINHILKNLILLASPSLLLVGCYFLINYSIFDRILPVSGSIKSSFPFPQPRLGYLAGYREFTILMLCAVIFIIIYIKDLIGKAGFSNKDNWNLDTVTAFFSAGYLVLSAWIVLFMHWGVYDWHFIPGIILVIPTSIKIIKLVDYLNGKIKIPQLKLISFLSIVLILLFLNGKGILKHHTGRHLFFYKNYEAANWVNENIPEESVFAMTECGIFGYYCDRKVVNLDGVVNNNEYQKYLSEGRLVDYLKDKSVDYIVEFKLPKEQYLSSDYTNYKFEVWSYKTNSSGGILYLDKQDELYRTPIKSYNPKRGLSIVIFRLPWSHDIEYAR